MKCTENVLTLELVIKKTGFEWSQPSYFKLEKNNLENNENTFG